MVSEQNKAVAARMRELRDIMEMSEADFAKICGVTVERYRELESGNTEIPISIMFSLEKAYSQCKGSGLCAPLHRASL